MSYTYSVILRASHVASAQVAVIGRAHSFKNMQKYADLVCLKIAPFSLEFDQGTRPGIQKNPQGSTLISSCETPLKKQKKVTLVLAKWKQHLKFTFWRKWESKKTSRIRTSVPSFFESVFFCTTFAIYQLFFFWYHSSQNGFFCPVVFTSVLPLPNRIMGSSSENKC